MKWGRTTLVIVGALIVTALGIDAADSLGGVRGTLLSQVIGTEAKGACPAGMVEVDTIGSLTCVDAYEVSAGDGCPVPNPSQLLNSQRNVNAAECHAVSKAGALPWTFISRDQAMRICAKDGKRLPTSGEWYALSLGMTDVERACNVSSGKMSESGANASCVSGGVFDLVGNVWEWVSDDVTDGRYDGTALPGSGYVTAVDADGMASAIDAAPAELYEKDYFWSRTDGAYGIIRGGYYDSGTDAGLYAVHADTPPGSGSIGIGFRCVK
ncbi:MAG TPA: SUMF1/EgtB/PvdO family nonheme iron enzyme [Candidatus Paceibacterota bacterium]|nr:SUMF1/EgtB/PvdO family nonheme iron enzyme [Candidatus Paceibacterota bacterium]